MPVLLVRLERKPDDGFSAVGCYQFNVVLRGVSPMVWRPLLLRSDNSIADPHYAIQTAMGRKVA